MENVVTKAVRNLGIVAAAISLCAAPAAATGGDHFQAGSTWKALHGDPQNRDFVPLAGARELVPTWKALQVKADSAVVTIGPEGNLYTITMDEGPCHLHALDANGNELWCSDQVRTAYSYPAVADDGSIFVTDGTEAFRFAPDGTILWRVPATGISLGFVFSHEGYPITFDSLGLATAYDPETGDVVAQLAVPSGVLPRPNPLTGSLQYFHTGAPMIGIDPAFVDTFINLFWDYETAIGNNIPAVHPESGRLFIAVSADETATEGVFYGIDFAPPSEAGGSGEFSIACQAPIGLASGTSPAISRDGERVYAGDNTGLLTAFSAEDCSIVWTHPLEAASLASPTVGENGRFYMVVNQKVFGFLDTGTSAEVLFSRGIAMAGLQGRFNSVLPLTSNHLYGAATLIGGGLPVAHLLVTIDPESGRILAAGELGEESDSAVSIAADGSAYVPSKPIVKGVLLGNPKIAPKVPPAQSGVFGFAPASYAELSFDGVVAAQGMVNAALAALDTDVEAADSALAQTVRQTGVVNENLERAEGREEIESLERGRAEARVLLAYAAFTLAEATPIPDNPRLAKLALRFKRLLTEEGVRQLGKAEELLQGYQRGNGTLVEDATLEHGGLTRYFDYYVPAGLPEEPVPLLFVFHGGTGDAKVTELAETGEFRDIADREKLIVVYPNGTSSATGGTGSTGSFNWNDCRSDAGPGGTIAADVGFVSALIDWAGDNFEIDGDRVFATGASNGGLMSYRLALELSDRIAAVAAVIANQPANSECPSSPEHPVSVLIMNGTADDELMPWDGGFITDPVTHDPRGAVLSALATRDLWRGILDTDPEPAVQEDLPDRNPDDGSTVSFELYEGGEDGTRLAFYTVHGGGHAMPSIQHPRTSLTEALGGDPEVQNRDIEAAELIWSFFEEID